jgi:hypothetical protein
MFLPSITTLTTSPATTAKGLEGAQCFIGPTGVHEGDEAPPARSRITQHPTRNIWGVNIQQAWGGILRAYK